MIAPVLIFQKDCNHNGHNNSYNDIYHFKHLLFIFTLSLVAYLFGCLLIDLFTYSFLDLSIYLSIYLSISLSIYLSIYLSIHFFIY